jgi:SAM-dependent methyltransferase
MVCRRFIVLSFLAVLALGLPSAAMSQGIGPLAPAGAPTNTFPTPDRPIAEIISPIWATERERDAVGESDQLIRLLGLTPGMSVADVGAGSGYHTVRLARALGPDGRVFAQDVTPKYLAGLQRRVRDEGLSNVTLGLGEPHDPRLPPGSVDAAILVHMYHEIAQPFAFLYNLVPALKPGARVGIVDLDRPTWEHGTPRDLLRCELAAVGYEQIGFSELAGKIGYLAVFAPPAEAQRPANAAPLCPRTSQVRRCMDAVSAQGQTDAATVISGNSLKRRVKRR